MQEESPGNEQREQSEEHSLLGNFAVLLVGTQSTGNVGSCARAMFNMGLERLVLVAPECDPQGEESRWMARDAWPLVEQAAIFPTLEAALASFHYAIATTARTGKRRGAAPTPRNFFPTFFEQPLPGDIALVFGPEDRGLSSLHLSRCQQLLTIPTSERFSSINLAQAVMLVTYELFLALRTAPSTSQQERVELGGQEPLFQDLQEVLLEIGYLDTDNPEHIMLDLRRLFGRAGLTRRDVRILRGIVRQIRWATGKEE